MANLNYIFFVVCCVIGVCIGQIVENGQCNPNISVAEDFIAELFGGTWYELLRSDDPEQIAECSRFELTYNNGNYAVSLNGINKNFAETWRGNLTANGSAKFVLDAPIYQNPIDFWVTYSNPNHTQFAVAYSCQNITQTTRRIKLWILGRNNTSLTDLANQAINLHLNDTFGFDMSRLKTVDHSNITCYELPIIAPGQSIILPGLCDTQIPVQQNFNVSGFLGTWHEIASYYTESSIGSCIRAEYSLGNGVVDVLNSQVINEALLTITGNASVISTDGSARLQVILNVADNVTVTQDLLVLATDYSNYAISYSCQNDVPNNQRRVFSFILSRQRQLNPTAQIAVNNVIDSILDLNEVYFTQTDQSPEGCFFYPEPNGQPVVFRGQCDMNIPAMPAFDPVAYMGLWHNIELYPAVFQDGTCGNAEYTLIDGQVDVYNTQVVNETLDTINGIAVLASDDGSAKLRVTFPIAGTNFTITTDYWVLDTNYTSYALVYSCFNIDEENMQVSSWKLSRTKSLNTEDRVAIDTVMNTTKVLDQRYFEVENQTVEGCFFVPTPIEGVPVVFPGQCDPNLGMQNFNLSQFVGTWYEIEAYPKEEQTGECISYEYTFISNTELNLTSLSVDDNFLVETQGRLISTDNTGRLIINITSGNQNIIIPFWIIDTDYSNYAVAYACVNRTDDLKAVFSWKLSRTRQLSTANETAISNAIANIDVLDNMYYWPIDHSDRACFNLPVIPAGEPVIIPGLCDASISGIANFNLTAFDGRWRLIESYYSEFQTGTCNEANYSQINNQTLGVTNIQVLNQMLSSISGNATLSRNDGSGVLQFNFDNNAQSPEYIILDTDYNSYVLAYSCENLTTTNQRRVNSWKFSRGTTLTAAANANINRKISEIDVLNNRYFNAIDRTEAGCFYFPEVNPNSPVRFRGTCNESIPAVPNFDPVQYMGLWHDIQSYPEDFQIGTCQNAQYTLVEGVVDVFNTQVINQTLDTMSGTAVLVSDDGSAKLNVTFNVGGVFVTTNYWVLATNYTNYALVYSCRQVDDEYYQVSSWKLSRTRELTSEAIAEINAVTNQIPVLDDKYYLNRSQTPEDCFYFPEPAVNSPVVFPGRCDNTIAAISNFNSTQFAGVWHEIEKYPYGPSDSCIDHRLELGASSSFNHNSFHVVNQTLVLVNNSTMSLTSIDGTGRLTIDIVVNGTVQTIPFWILDTDYFNYALAYGCRDLDNDFRQIYSWKLTRTRQANNLPAFNATFNNIDVLDNRYFQTTPQTDEACFYLPELGPNEPVTFIGQCDPNIPVVSNFNATAYLGTWRLIETYPTEFQNGTCNTAQYSAGNNSVVVINTQVINQTLDSLTGFAVLASTDGSGKLLVYFPTSPTPSEYWILGTDYNSYSLVYTCENITPDRRRVWSWKLSRTTTLTANAITAIDTIVNSTNVLNERYFQTVNNTDDGCFYYPEPNENATVVFPGQCDMNITAMANFDAARYLNLWYDIESYPAPFQTGTCSKANYTLNADGSVRVENTQVLNQRLETWIGSAVVVSDDGSAKLNVTFNINGINVTTNLWVLDTDYESYSLVYSCDNLTPYTRAVFSWKLSRFPTLLANASQAINNVIETIPVLRQMYYIPRSHSEEDCFYYPENNGGDVILPGQCVADSAVPAVTNFTANLFTGRWHEIYRFPSDAQTGECFTTEYSTGGTNTLIAARSFVFNESQFNSTTIASLSTDGRGVLTANISGVPFNTVYILGTDYTEYALAYSCRNLEGNQKQIYSWILSRSRDGLSATATNITNQLISSNIDLWEGYYRPTGQDNDACFFYPELDQLPDAIILPGPCPNNIRGVPNFDAAGYLGRWYETARYYARDQVGQCNRAQYSLGDVNGTQRVIVNNNEVLEQTLLTQLGYADIASTDGSGHLSVDFIVNGVQIIANYYILATDYTSYSLVYGCTNVTGGWRQVSSWKLSRTKTLTTNAMDPVIAATQGLRQEYYRNTSQSDEDCFYIPYNYDDRAPRFRGQCENITGVAGFDVQRYLGWWHEIERYPVDDPEVGECRSSEYAQDGNSYRVVDNWVRDNEGFVLPGTVTATSNGRLVRTMSGGRTQDIWVLATDYDTYALLYACEQIDDEYRQVWSAKHSKSRSLPTAAQNIMSPIIANNSVLYPQFYRDVDQSDGTCFHYPAIAEGEAIVIPGQCNVSIAVVQNLNIADFSGTWYQTERYDAVNGSSCVGSRYEVEGNNIKVFNVEVRNGETIHTEGTATVSESSGLIQITMPFSDLEGNTTSLYILETDYTSYAVAYNCVNINNYQRQIRAWKLSRERSLSPQSNTAIESLINRTQELYQPYFKTISQEDNCPEPSSAFLIKSSIIVLLLCAMLQWLV